LFARVQIAAALTAAEDAMKAEGVHKGLLGNAAWITSDKEYLVRAARR
jgi:hypothetical protein